MDAFGSRCLLTPTRPVVSEFADYRPTPGVVFSAICDCQRLSKLGPTVRNWRELTCSSDIPCDDADHGLESRHRERIAVSRSFAAIGELAS